MIYEIRHKEECTFSPNTNKPNKKKKMNLKSPDKDNDWLELNFLERVTIYSEY